MNIEKKVKSIVDLTTNDLVNGKYKLVEIGQHTSRLEYGTNAIDVWIANGTDCCRIYSKVNGLEFPEFDDETKKVVYKLATTKTDYMIKKVLRKARKTHRDSYLKYKENIGLVKKLEVELKSFVELKDTEEC